MGGVGFSEQDHRKLQRAIGYLKNGLEEPPNVDELASLVSHSRQKLQFGFRSVCGDTVARIRDKLRMAQEARRLGFRLMVGNMIGTSWAMASAFVVGQWCEIVDLDGPLLLNGDREPAVRYRDGYIECPDEVWGAP